MNYSHLNIYERIVISQLYASGVSIREISRQLQRSPSTISREIKKNSDQTGKRSKTRGYDPVSAQKKYEERRENCGRKILDHSKILDYVKSRIEDHWSPEQISNRKTASLKIPSTSTIYRMLHQKRLGRVSMKDLRRKGRFKNPAETRGKFNDKGRMIKKRPKEIYKRKELGHWEGDTVESGRIGSIRKSKYCFVTLAERKSRFYIAVLVPDRTEASVTPAIVEALKRFPDELVKTITFDRGKEFSGFEEIEKELNCRTYFCDPYCAWQKGTNENTNGLLREFYPKGMDLSKVDKDELNHILELMNDRPRKCLGFKTPKEILFENSDFNECCS